MENVSIVGSQSRHHKCSLGQISVWREKMATSNGKPICGRVDSHKCTNCAFHLFRLLVVHWHHREQPSINHSASFQRCCKLQSRHCQHFLFRVFPVIIENPPPIGCELVTLCLFKQTNLCFFYYFIRQMSQLSTKALLSIDPGLFAQGSRCVLHQTFLKKCSLRNDNIATNSEQAKYFGCSY